ncbi:hypothetical protein QE152_g23709 [Popillia japonica]|uniref:Uncharacterized protein n=1 Tax=Popillia japonica TaxID=7064 RepID=A0AAW1KD38_POPJA
MFTDADFIAAKIEAEKTSTAALDNTSEEEEMLVAANTALFLCCILINMQLLIFHHMIVLPILIQLPLLQLGLIHSLLLFLQQAFTTLLPNILGGLTHSLT